MPQPPEFADLALDRQRGVPGSTYELYREALRLRRSLALGTGGLAWLSGYPDTTLAFANRDLLVVANLGTDPVPAPAGARMLLASTDAPDDGTVPPDTTIWFTR